MYIIRRKHVKKGVIRPDIGLFVYVIVVEGALFPRIIGELNDLKIPNGARGLRGDVKCKLLISIEILFSIVPVPITIISITLPTVNYLPTN